MAVDRAAVKQLVGLLETSITREYGHEWQVGTYPDRGGTIVTVSCCRTPGASSAVRVQEMTQYIASQSKSAGYFLTQVHSHDAPQPIISFLVAEAPER